MSLSFNVPEHVEDRDLNTLNLSLGARNALHRAGFVSLADFHGLTKRDLLAVQHVGKKRALEIATALEEYLSDIPEVAPSTRQQEKLKEEYLSDIPEVVPSYRQQEKPKEESSAPDWIQDIPVSELPATVCSANKLSEGGITTVGDLYVYIANNRLRSVSGIGAKNEKVIQTYLNQLLRLGPATLERVVNRDAKNVLPGVGMEIVSAILEADSVDEEIRGLSSNLSERNSKLFLARLSHRRKEQPTLEELGDEVGLTRERVRQITRRQEELLKRSDLRLPICSELIRIIDCEGGLASTNQLLKAARTNGIRLKDHDIFALPFLSELNLINSVQYLTDKESWVTKLGAARWLESGILDDLFSRLRRMALASYREISSVPEEPLTSLSPLGRSQVLCAVKKKGHDLISDHGFLLLDPPPDSTLVRELRKMLVVADRLSVRDARAGLVRHRTIDVVPPPPVLRHILKLHPEFNVNADAITPRDQLDRRQVLSDSEQSLLKLFETNRNVLGHYEIVDGIVEAGFSKATANALMRSPILTRPEIGIYTLRGKNISHERMNEVQRARRDSRSRNKLDSGWLDPTTFEVTYRLNRHNLKGVLAIPSGFKTTIESWEGILPNGQATSLTARNGFLWSLRDWFREGVRQGDIVVATFYPAESRVEFEHIQEVS